MRKIKITKQIKSSPQELLQFHKAYLKTLKTLRWRMRKLSSLWRTLQLSRFQKSLKTTVGHSSFQLVFRQKGGHSFMKQPLILDLLIIPKESQAKIDGQLCILQHNSRTNKKLRIGDFRKKQIKLKISLKSLVFATFLKMQETLGEKATQQRCTMLKRMGKSYLLHLTLRVRIFQHLVKILLNI